MKTTMRLLAIVIALTLALCVTGCKKDEAVAGTQDTQPATEATQPEQETNAEEVVAEATEATEAVQEQPTEQPTEQTATQEQSTEPTATPDQTIEVTEDVEFEDEILWDEDFGIGPRITVTWQTYESMTEAEQAAYRACFSNDRAFEDWSDMAYMMYETEIMEDEFVEVGTLNLKDIVEYLTGEEFD